MDRLEQIVRVHDLWLQWSFRVRILPDVSKEGETSVPEQKHFCPWPFPLNDLRARSISKSSAVALSENSIIFASPLVLLTPLLVGGIPRANVVGNARFPPTFFRTGPAIGFPHASVRIEVFALLDEEAIGAERRGTEDEIEGGKRCAM